jgi:amidophosphoribosyltransferase
MEDHARDACGVVGIYEAPGNAASLAFLGLHALQHRGQESAGIVTQCDGRLRSHKGMGLVANVFAEAESRNLPGRTAIGHVRYSTAGESSFINAQPLMARYMHHHVALAHNGNLSCGETLRARLVEQGALFQTTTDSELILHMLAQNQAHSDEEIGQVLEAAGAAFAIVMLFDDKRLVAARDPWGFRPLSLGRLDTGYVVASESSAFDQIGARFERDLLPGEMLVFKDGACRSLMFAKEPKPLTQCLLELIYFSRPDSVVFGHSPHIFRQESGAMLAREHPADVDIVVAIPDSGMSAAMGFAEEMGVRFERGLIRNHYVGRSFIAPGPEARATAVRMKHNIVRDVVRGKRVALVDDSLIRGTTTNSLNRALREAGATEVHLRIACPPTCHPCPYGIDFPKPEELLAYHHSVEQIRGLLGMDSLGYLSLEGLVSLFGEQASNYCTACWSGSYRA